MANYKQIASGICLISAKPPCLFIRLAALLMYLASRDGVLATQYTVGDTSGWTLGVDYSTWASKNSFKAGDSLLFSYGGSHSVLQVSEEDYNACNTANAISTGTGGDTTVKLEKVQTYYFICGVAGHCAGGMQLSVKVSAATSSSTTPSTTPSTSTTPSSSTSPTTTSSPKDNSSTPPLPLHNLTLFTVLIAIVCAAYLMFT